MPWGEFWEQFMLQNLVPTPERALLRELTTEVEDMKADPTKGAEAVLRFYRKFGGRLSPDTLRYMMTDDSFLNKVISAVETLSAEKSAQPAEQYVLLDWFECDVQRLVATIEETYSTLMPYASVKVAKWFAPGAVMSILGKLSRTEEATLAIMYGWRLGTVPMSLSDYASAHNLPVSTASNRRDRALARYGDLVEQQLQAVRQGTWRHSYVNNELYMKGISSWGYFAEHGVTTFAEIRDGSRADLEAVLKGVQLRSNFWEEARAAVGHFEVDE